MSNQEAKQVARQVVRDLLSKYPPGFVIIVLRQLKVLLRATKDITKLSDENGVVHPISDQEVAAGKEHQNETCPITDLTPEREIEIIEELKDRFLWLHPFPYESSPLFLGSFNGTLLPEAVASIYPNLTPSQIQKLIGYALSDVRG